MGLMSRGMNWLAAKVQAAGGRAVTYTRGVTSVTVTATPAEILEERPATDEPTRAESRRRDYLIAVADLAAAGVSGEPRTGDRITEVINGEAKVFDVLPRDDERSWRYSDVERTTYRIHTRPQG